jgi:arsenite transporter
MMLRLTFPAVGLIVMMYPILCKVKFEQLDLIFKQKGLWVQLGFSFVVNWIIAPLVMVSLFPHKELIPFQVGLAWAFLPDKQSYREGLILVGLARCIAMVLLCRWLLIQVLVWNDLAGGDGDYCAILVAFNSLLQMVLYAPFAIFYINVVRPPSQASENVVVSYSVVARSVAVFLGIPPSPPPNLFNWQESPLRRPSAPDLSF